MRVSIASDHAGYALKERVREHLESAGHDIVDLGTTSEESTDYPDFGAPAARMVARGETDCAVLVCGSGQGMCMTANKVDGVRAALAWTPTIAELSRNHNNANALCLPARFLSVEDALGIVDAWLDAGFDGGRHERRVEKMMNVEKGEE
ncbi:MAG: ribose 5-phosphate isomerase B [Candidatus Eisenbacteria bacterium]|nr:ribose 5-phosphate isomerase B [Candidatus Eisenbacteria bacterium]